MTILEIKELLKAYGTLETHAQDCTLIDLINCVDEAKDYIKELRKILEEKIPKDADIVLTRKSKYTAEEIEGQLQSILMQTIGFVQSKEAKRVIRRQIQWVSPEERLPSLMNGGIKYASSDDLLILNNWGYYNVGWFRYYHFDGKKVFVFMDGKQFPPKFIKKWAIIPTPERCNATNY